MTVREFNGTSDRLVTDVGAASGMAYGTLAAIVKFSDLSTFRGISYAHDSSGVYKGAFGTTNFSRFSVNDGSNDSNLGAAVLSTGVWYLCVVRKATGAGVLPRFSVYDFTAGTWIHGAGSAALNDFVPPGVGGTHQFAYQGGAASIFAGRVAIRAHWSNTLPWTADAAGDTTIEAAGLHTKASVWASANPTVLHLFNQANASTPVDDQSTAGTADQVSIVGTTAVTGDDPPGFDFTLASAVTGQLTGALPALTGSLAGSITTAATLSGSLPAVQGSFTGAAVVDGQLAASLPALQGSITGDVAAAGSLAGQLASITAAFAGTARVSGTLAGTMHAILGAFTGTAGPLAPYDPVIDPVASIRSNLATATPRANAATATIRANSTEAAP